MIRLITSYYKDSDAGRQKEIELCLKNNIKNSVIDEIILLSESKINLGENTKVNVISRTRPTFGDFFKVINDVTKSTDINILTNSDIFFDDSLSNLNSMDLSNTVLSLLRWEYNNKNPKILQYRGDCQDTWIWCGKLKKLKYVDFYLGKLGCDNRIAWEFKNAGYNLKNPCNLIKSIHLHETNTRNYNQTFVGTPEHEKNKDVVPPPYLYVYPE